MTILLGSLHVDVFFDRNINHVGTSDVSSYYPSKGGKDIVAMIAQKEAPEGTPYHP